MPPTPARLGRAAAARRSGPGCSGGSTASILPTRPEPRLSSVAVVRSRVAEPRVVLAEQIPPVVVPGPRGDHRVGGAPRRRAVVERDAALVGELDQNDRAV